MIKSFIPKTSDVNQKLKKILIIIIAVIIVIIIAAIVFLVLWEKKTKETLPEFEFTSEKMKKGQVGEIEKGETLEDVNPEALVAPVRSLDVGVPPVISNTKGKIISIEKNGIIIIGSGENFEDQKQRTLNVKFNQETITFEKGQKIKYIGAEGLKHLELDEQVSISSPENIRGKTEFFADYVNKS